jgi:hypothetical protein
LAQSELKVNLTKDSPVSRDEAKTNGHRGQYSCTRTQVTNYYHASEKCSLADTVKGRRAELCSLYLKYIYLYNKLTVPDINFSSLMTSIY